MGIIEIEKLKIYAYHGVYDFEKEKGQNFYVSCSLKLRDSSFSGDSHTDELEQTVNYALVCESIVSYVKDTRFNLIETLGEGLAVHLLNLYPGIWSVSLTVEKPEAPVSEEFKSIAYKTERSRHRVCISYGSNLGDSEKLIADGIEELKNLPGNRILKDSELYVTKPYGGVQQDDFINGCLLLETYASPEELLDHLHLIEAHAGRERTLRWGPRTLDMDIIFYDELILHRENLIIPHIDMQNREFVLEPLAKIVPYAYHPILKKTVQELYDELLKKTEDR